MAYPKITYVDANGDPQQLIFQLPPTGKPYANKEATRNDVIASSGLKQSSIERVDAFMELTLGALESGEDADAWVAFLDVALEGAEFEYYPDADADIHSTFTLEDKSYKMDRKFFERYGIKLQLRKAVTA